MIGDTLFLLISGLIFASIGSVLWRGLTRNDPSGDARLGLALPLGLGFSGTVVGVAASLGSFMTGLVAILLFGIISTILTLANFTVHSGDNRTPEFFRHPVGRILAVLVCVLILPGLFAPVVDGDALCYHLEVAKRMAMDGRVVFDPDLHETAYPLLVESLQAVALKLRGPVATRAISFWFGISLSFAAVCLARSIVTGGSRYWAAILLVISPIVHCGMIAPLNDVALASLCTCALASWVTTESMNLSIGRRYAMVGLFCGLACGVKFPGIVWLVVMVVYLMNEGFQRNQDYKIYMNKKLQILSCVIICAIFSGGFWYARSAVLTGNPVHPYFRNTFGGRGLDEVLEDARKTPLEHVVNIVAAPVGLALDPGRFDSFSHQIGPSYLMLIPVGFLFRPSKRWKEFVYLGLLLMALCLTQRQSPRFYIAALALWSAASAKVIGDMIGMVKRQKNRISIYKNMLTCMITATCFLLVMFDIARVRVGASVVLGTISPARWLHDNEPSVKLSTWADSNLPEDARLVGQDHRAFYWPRPFTMEKAHRRRTGLLSDDPSPEAVIERLSNAGFTHLVMAEPDPIDAVEFDTDLSESLDPWLNSHIPLLDEVIRERDGYVRRYRIYDLGVTTLEHRNRVRTESPTSETHDPMLRPVSFDSSP